jgi:hypothetical protein
MPNVEKVSVSMTPQHAELLRDAVNSSAYAAGAKLCAKPCVTGRPSGCRSATISLSYVRCEKKAKRADLPSKWILMQCLRKLARK